MTEILHAWALAPAAIGTCCLAADRRRVRAPELAASVLMLLAMTDAASLSLLAPVYWAAILLLAGMGLAAVRGARRAAPRSAHADAAMTVHATVGLVVMAALLIAMGGSGHAAELSPAAQLLPAGGHAHGGPGSAFAIAVGAGVAAYAAASVVAGLRASRWLDRVQYAGMGLSAVVMALALLV